MVRGSPLSPLSSQTRRSTLSTVGNSFGSVNNVVDDPIWSNPFIQDALQLLDQIADIGKTVPFIAPVFVMLKLIIEVEKSAHDADSKCNDLLERITFMTSHLLVLKDITILPGTRQVVDRVTEALKEAAALVTTYRKQNRITRRLALGNRERFASCAEKVKLCTNDLLMSLQIHQTVKLDVLTRAIPYDPEDAAAQTFVQSHGNFETVAHSHDLVSQFAKEQHIQMDDKVMEQLNTNFSDSIRQTEERLENILKENVGAAVIDGLKGLAAQMNAVEAEQRLLCVQCLKEFRVSTNGPKSCSFHVAQYWDKKYSCCSGSTPCQYQSHRANHHCDYPYGPFFDYAHKILGYTDTLEKWTEIEDVNLETNDKEIASVDRLIRWVSRADYIKDPTVLIRVGRVWHTNPYFFDTFTAKELQAISQVVSITRDTLIYRTSDDENEFSMAEWEISSSGVISGVRITVKCATSENSFVRICPIDITTGQKSGEIIRVSDGGLPSYKPDQPYVLPKTVQVGPVLTDKPLREIRHFKTRTTPDFRVILKSMSDPPLVANPKWANQEVDYFEGGISVFNNFAAASQNPISIASVDASYRLIGDESYTPVSKFEFVDGYNLPVTVDARQTWSFKFLVSVPRSGDDIKLRESWWNRAFVARHRPLRLKIILKDVEDRECSLVMEYVYRPYAFDTKGHDEICRFYIDDYGMVQRHSVVVKRDGMNGSLIDVGTINLPADRLKKIVYSAIKTGETEVELQNYCSPNTNRFEWKAWGLVDLSCRRVYAVKVIMTEGSSVPQKRAGCLGYVLVPEYGDVINETRPIQYAVEKATLPELEPLPELKVVSDDEIDDFVPEPPKPAVQNDTVPVGSNGGTTTAHLIIPDVLNQRLASIDKNLARVADALEQMSHIMNQNMVQQQMYRSRGGR